MSSRFQQVFRNFFFHLNSQSDQTEIRNTEHRLPLINQPDADHDQIDQKFSLREYETVIQELESIQGVFIRRKIINGLIKKVITHNIYPLTQDRNDLEGTKLFKCKENSQLLSYLKRSHMNITYKKHEIPFISLQKSNNFECGCEDKFPWTVLLHRDGQNIMIGNIIKDKKFYCSKFNILDRDNDLKYILDGSSILSQEGDKVGTVQLTPESATYCIGNSLDFEINFPHTASGIEKVLIIIAAIIRVRDYAN